MGIDFLGIRQTAIVNFVFGTPFDLELEVQSNGAVNTFGGRRGGLNVDLSHTVLWGGIEDMFLTDDLGNLIGNEITDSTISSDSQSNYANAFTVAVPEPATYGVMGAVFLVLGAFWRRRQRAS